jgi:hypothetical protein
MRAAGTSRLIAQMTAGGQGFLSEHSLGTTPSTTSRLLTDVVYFLWRILPTISVERMNNMVGPNMSPNTYQQVKANLHWYMVVASALFAILTYFFLVPDIHRRAIVRFIASHTSDSMPHLVTSASLVALLGFVCWLSIFIFEVHDKIYDRYVIRWRHYYDLDFILPTLTRPFTCNMDPQFFRAAEKNIYEFMKPYYAFVGDGKRAFPITKNLLVRFYESITKYWITQINEILLIEAFALDAVYFFIYRQLQLPIDRIAIWSLVLPIAFSLNRIAAVQSRIPVRRATLDEIEDIQRRYPDRLKEAFQELHTKFNLQWRP